MSTGDQPTEEELRAAYEAEIKKIRVEQILLDQVVSLINGPAADGYPIVNYEYAVVYSSQKDPAVAQTIQAFLHWAVTDGDAPSYLNQFHFQPLPASVAKLSDAQIATISG